MCCLRIIEITCPRCGLSFKVKQGDVITPSDLVHVCPRCLKVFGIFGDKPWRR